MTLSIIIPTKDRSEIVSRTILAALEATLHIEAEIIIVNDSKTTTPVVPPAKNIILLNNIKSGVASARNYGFRKSSGKIVLFLDNDILISKASINHVLEFHATHPHACLNLNWLYTPETMDNIGARSFSRFLTRFGMTSFKGWYNDNSWKDGELFKSKSIASFHLSMRRESFEKTTGYNEEFSHAGFEDYDFPIQLKKAGIEFFIDSRIKVYHNEVDKLKIDNWLFSQERRAETRKIAVSLGYTELSLEYAPFKRRLLRIILAMERMLMMSANLLPNAIFFDPAYFKIISILQAARIFKGYNSSDDYGTQAKG
jgi:glycosyltransferase involved in cell wall biosynthesis